MNTFGKTALSLLAGMGLAASLPAAADETVTFAPLLRDVVTSHPGVETITPYMVIRDTNSDGVPDVFYVEWRVYNGSTFIHKSQGRAVTFPHPTCTNEGGKGAEFETAKFLETGSSRVVGAFQLFAWCYGYDELTHVYKTGYKTLVFSANAATANDAGWVSVVNQEMLGFDAVDMAGGPTAEFVLTSTYDINPANQAAYEENVVVRALDAATGDVVFTGNYPMTRP